MWPTAVKLNLEESALDAASKLLTRWIVLIIIGDDGDPNSTKPVKYTSQDLCIYQLRYSLRSDKLNQGA